MGTVYAIANQKGGVGKTTTAVNLGACVAESGYRTLLVDLDPQCNATVALGVGKDAHPNVYDCLTDGSALDPAVSGDRRSRTSTSSRRAQSSPARTSSCRGCRAPSSASARACARVRGGFFLTLLDCPPSLGPLTVNALVAADKVIVPVQTEYFALEGLAGLLDTLGLIQRELNPQAERRRDDPHDARRAARASPRTSSARCASTSRSSSSRPSSRATSASARRRATAFRSPSTTRCCPGSVAYLKLAKEVAARA